MSSARLPGKVLREVGGRPLLEHLLRRLDRCEGLDAVLVATSVDRSDDPLAEFCRARGVEVFRGALEDVAGRFLGALERHPATACVRLSADSPLLDPALVDRAVREFLAGGWDLVTNVHPRSFPKGQSVEVLAPSLLRARHPAMDAEDREHVTRAFYRSPGGLRILNLAGDRDLSGIQLSVDTPEDLAAFAALVAAMTRPPETYGLEELLRLRAGPVEIAGSTP